MKRQIVLKMVWIGDICKFLSVNLHMLDGFMYHPVFTTSADFNVVTPMTQTYLSCNSCVHIFFMINYNEALQIE